MINTRQGIFGDVHGYHFDFLVIIAQLGMQALQHRLGMPIEQALAENAVYVAAQLGFANLVSDDLAHQFAEESVQEVWGRFTLTLIFCFWSKPIAPNSKLLARYNTNTQFVVIMPISLGWEKLG